MESSLPPLFNGQPLRAIDLPEIPMDPATELSYVALEDKSIYIGGLPRHLTTELLTELLIQMGPVIQVRMLKDATGASKGAAFCDFADPRSAQYAIAALDTLPLVGRKLRVNRAGDSGRTHVPFMVVLQELACREPTTRLDRYDPRGAGRDSRREEVCREREDELNGNSRWSHIDDSCGSERPRHDNQRAYQSREYGRERNRARSRERSLDWSREQSHERSRERRRERSCERSRERSREQSREQSRRGALRSGFERRNELANRWSESDQGNRAQRQARQPLGFDKESTRRTSKANLPSTRWEMNT
mmetsp:Transcript_37095/g.61411  ORF Transcript_37095/g.61411 Transcript_37095/m.61411 type:complete len:305 (-) Transcript_37095:317-1231(-)